AAADTADAFIAAAVKGNLARYVVETGDLAHSLIERNYIVPRAVLRQRRQIPGERSDGNLYDKSLALPEGVVIGEDPIEQVIRDCRGRLPIEPSLEIGCCNRKPRSLLHPKVSVA